MIKSGDVWIGWVENGSIIDVSKRNAELLNQSLVLITCIDSTRDASSLVFRKITQALEHWAVEYRLMQGGIIISGSMLPKIAAEFFRGFDEVWLFRNNPPEHIPDTVMITSEVPITDNDYVGWQTAIIKWVVDSGCLLGLGDGIGLNYVTPNQYIARRLECENEPDVQN